MENIPEVLTSIKGSETEMLQDDVVFYTEDDNLRLTQFYDV